MLFFALLIVCSFRKKEAKFRLPKDIDRAIDVAKDISKYKTVRGEHTQAKISVKKDDHEHETSFVYLRKEAPEKVELLKDALLQKYCSGLLPWYDDKCPVLTVARKC